MVAAAQTLTSLPLKIKKERKEGTRKRTLGTDDDAHGLLVEGDENVGTDLNAFPSVPANKKLRKGTADDKLHVEIKGEPHIRNGSIDVLKNKIELPRGTPVTNVVRAKLEADDVGSAIQFYEFCRTFAEVFQIKKGQPEKVLQVITERGRIRREVPSFVADLHISLLSVIQEDRAEKPLDFSRDADAWITETGKYISESIVLSKEVPLDCLNQGVLGYKKLSAPLKLHVLNFLCDETLSTTTLRDWIVKKNESVTERKTAAREKIRAVKEKEKELKERLKNEMTKSMFLRKGAEINRLISQIKELNEDKEEAVDGTSRCGFDASRFPFVTASVGLGVQALNFMPEDVVSLQPLQYMVGEAGGGVKEQGRRPRTGSSGPSWCGGAAGKEEEVGAGGVAPPLDLAIERAVVVAHPHPLSLKRLGHHQTEGEGGGRRARQAAGGRAGALKGKEETGEEGKPQGERRPWFAEPKFV